jgi:hypothetical protein
MGLFSKTKIFVESFSTPLVEETPNMVQQSVLTSIRGERSISDDLIANTISGLGSNLKRYYRYGAEEYFYGVPTGSIKNQGASVSNVQNVISQEIGEEVLVDFSVFSTADGYYFALDFLLNTRGLNETTFVVSNPPAGATGATVFQYAKIVSSNQIELTYQDTLDNEIVETYVYSGSILEDANYYHVGYFKYDTAGEVDPSVTFYWFYSPEEGTYEVLEPYEEFDSNYFPVVPLRYNNSDYTVDNGSERYDTSRRLLRQLRLNIRELGNAINENPDIGDIDHAFVVMGISPATKNKAAQSYLYDFWKDKENVARYTKDDYDRWTDRDEDFKLKSPPSINTLSIAEAGISYNVELGWLYIESTFQSGTFAPDAEVGDVETEIIVRTPVSGQYYSYEDSSFIVRKQITAATYDEVEVRGLNHINYVYRSHTVDTSLANVVSSAADEDDFSDGMLIPLDIRLVENMRVVDRTDLANEAMRITFNCYVKQKLKWYQTTFFSVFVAIIGIVITIYTFGTTSASMGAWLGLGTGVTAAVVGAIALGVIMVGIRYGINYLADNVGIAAAVVFAIFATLALGNVGGANQSNMAQALSALQSGIDTGLQAYLDIGMRDIIDDYEALQREINQYEEEMNEFYAETSTAFLVDPFAIPDTTSGLALPNETAEQYYNTRIHIGNMAPIDKAHIENYVDNKLTLEGVATHYGIKV